MAVTLPIDYAGLVTMGQKLYNTMDGFLEGANVPAIVAKPAAGIAAGVVMAFPALLAVVVQGIVGVGTWFAVTMLTLITEVRTQNASDFNQVIGAALSELLGVEIDGNLLPGGQGANGIGQRMQAIGGALHNTLLNELGGLRPIQAIDGFNNAQRFSGFAINFATSSAFIAMLTEFESLGLLKEFRELGVMTAESLGLGRLQRLAMQPLIQNLIQKPYNLYMQSATRPTRMSEAQTVKAFRMGVIDESTCRDALAQAGYRDSDIDILLQILTDSLSAAELETLVRYNIITRDTAKAQLKLQGASDQVAEWKLQAIENQRADTQVSALLSDLQSAYLEGFVDEVTYNNTLQGLPLTDEEETMYRTRVGFKQDRARKTLTLAQVQTAIVEAAVTFDYFDTWLGRQGYSAEDQTVLWFETLEKLKAATDKEAFKKYKADQLRAANKPVPPWLLPS